MSSDDARGAVVEIIERRRNPDDGSVAASITVPNEVWLNGQKLLTSAEPEHAIKVHQIELPDRDAVLVTLTVFARRVVIEGRDSEPANTRAFGEAQPLHVSPAA